MSKIKIIGITGAFGSGKSTASDFFEQNGFTKITLSSFLKEEIRKKTYAKITRKMLQDRGNKLRKKYGSGILAKRAIEYLKEENKDKAVIDGIRNVGEIDELRKNSNFVLLAIVVDRKIRFERLKNLKRREELTWELFNELDNKDLGTGEGKRGLQVAICLALSDIFIENNKEKEEFKSKLKNLLETIANWS